MHITCSRETDVFKTRVHHILRHEKWKPYIPRLLQALNEDDPDRRLQFCDWFLGMCDGIKSLLDFIVWSDEATFKLNETISRHNCVYWATENSNVTEERAADLPRTSVWCGMSSTRSMPLPSTPLLTVHWCMWWSF
jgi:hypothetical protein